MLLLLGCSDYDFNSKDEPTGHFDSGEPVEPPVETDGTVDSPPETSAPESCPDPDLSPATVSVDDSCVVDEVGSFTPVVEWHDDSPGDSMSTPVVGQLTDDNGNGLIDDGDIPDIVSASSSARLVVLSGDGAGVHWQLSGGVAEVAPAIGDLDGDGWPEVVGVSNNRYTAWRGDSGDVYWSSSYSTNVSAAYCGSVGIYDLDADGWPEVVAGSAVLDGQTGDLRGVGSAGVGTGLESVVAFESVAADLDLDGLQEVVVGNAAYDADGAEIWRNGLSDGYVAVGNFDSDPEGEVVVASYPGTLRLQDSDGSLIWEGSFTTSRIGPPTIADFDGDGEPEIGVAGNNVYVVVETDGSRLWQNSITDASSGCTGSSVFDFEGDGKAEVVFADELDVWVFDGATGAVKLQETMHGSLTCTEYPVIADVDADGHAEIVYASYTYGGDPTHGITVVGDADDSWMPGRGIWNQHGYAITNVGDLGEIPAVPDINWETYNSFRSGDLTATLGNEAADAVPDLSETCVVECEAGLLRVVGRVGSAGTGELPAGIPLSLYAARGAEWQLLGTQRTAAAVAAGQTSEGLVFEVDPAEVTDGLLKLVADDDGSGAGSLLECHEDNNELEIRDGLCP